MYKKILFTCCAIVSIPAFASNGDILAANNQISLQATTTKFDYTEELGIYGVPPGNLDTEHGNVTGFSLSASLMKDLWLGNDYLQARYSHNNGSVHYESYPPADRYTGSSGAKLDDFSLTYGKGFNLGEQAMLTPYIQYGYHKWQRQVGEQFDETYHHQYFGTGAKIQYAPIEKLVIGANLFVGRTLRPEISVDLPGVSGGSLGTKLMTTYGVDVDYAFTKHLHGSLGYERTQFKYGASAQDSEGGFEPNSTTRLSTFKVGVGYAF